MKPKKVTTPEELRKVGNTFFEAIAAIRSSKEAENFLEDLCTPAEIQAMADRWLTVGLIKAGKAYRKIQEETGISSTTVGRVARCLSMGTGGYSLIYERLKKRTYNEKSKTQNRTTKKRPSE